MSNLTQKILLLLLTGVAFGCSYTPGRQRYVIGTAIKEWKKLNQKKISGEVKYLYRSKLVKKVKNKDGSITILLTDKGKLKALTYHFQNMKIEIKNWDGKWRIVVFDIPEKLRWGRDALRKKLRELGFYELQKSVFIFPYECKDEIDFIVEFFNLKQYVRYGVLESIDNDDNLRKIFNLN
jgi:DNA-binding transcriptional regulator PaaX